MNYDLARMLTELRETDPKLYALATLPVRSDRDEDEDEDCDGGEA